MKTTKFAFYLNKFFTVYLPNTNGSTPATIDSYRYAFIHFFDFMEENSVTADEIEISEITRELMLDYLKWLQDKRGNSISTRNQRQAAINSFIKFLMYEFPDYLSEYQRILKIPVKKTPQKEISFLKPEEVKFLLEQVNVEKGNGLRDYAMLTLLFTTGIRVSELINIRVRDVSLSSPATLLVHGKGQKSRYVQLIKMAVKIMRDYMSKHGFDKERYFNDWLFKNHCKDRFTRQGVNYIIKKYTEKAGEVAPNVIPSDFSPHKMRHSAAMGLVEADVDLIYIRDLLGHVSVKTTEIYIKANAVRKREAIEAASKEIVAYEEPLWEENKGLKDWLKGFNRR